MIFCDFMDKADIEYVFKKLHPYSIYAVSCEVPCIENITDFIKKF